MRTTVTLSDEIVKQTLAASKKKRLSDALEATLTEHFALKKRLQLLDMLYRERVPHSFKKIKRERRGRKWSS
jgi:hypothetical protein